MAIAPYVLTPVGIYLVQKAREKKMATLGFLGAGALLGHAGGIIGDWWKIGRDVVYETAHHIGNVLGYESVEDNPFIFIGGGVLGMYLGSKAMSFTYRFSKGLVGSFRSLSGHKIPALPQQTDSVIDDKVEEKREEEK